MDTRTLNNLKLVYPDIRVRAFRIIEDTKKVLGRELIVTEGVRSISRQATLYAQGRTTEGKIVTWAKPGMSLHHYGLAIDFCFGGPDPYLAKAPSLLMDREWRALGRLIEGHGLFWGGNFRARKDYPHAELSYGLSVTECAELYRAGGVPAIWALCDEIRGVELGSEWSKINFPEKEELAS